MDRESYAEGRDAPGGAPYAEAVARHQDVLYGLALGVCPNPEAAREAYCLALSRGLHQADPGLNDSALLAFWCGAILGEGEGHSPPKAAVPMASGGDQGLRPEIPGAWTDCLAALPRDRRAAVLLRGAGFTADQAAEILQASPAWARFLTFHGLHLFTRELFLRGVLPPDSPDPASGAAEILGCLVHRPPPEIATPTALYQPPASGPGGFPERAARFLQALSPFSRKVLAHFAASACFLALSLVLGSGLFTTHPGGLSAWALDQQRFAIFLSLALAALGLASARQGRVRILPVWLSALLFLSGMSGQAVGVAQGASVPGLALPLTASVAALGALILALLAALFACTGGDSGSSRPPG